jgi:ribonucleoside-diphosphate reductase alpha chain
MIKQIYRKDCNQIKDFSFFQNEGIFIEDLFFTSKNNDFSSIEVVRITKHIFSILKKYAISFDNTSLLPVVRDFISSCKKNLTYGSLNQDLATVCGHYVEKDSLYSLLGAAFCLESILYEAMTFFSLDYSVEQSLDFKLLFKKSVEKGIEEGILSGELLTFDLDLLASCLVESRDTLFKYVGIYSLQKRFLLRSKKDKKVYEIPQVYWMRVAMGLSLHEKNKNEKAIEFYDILSTLSYLPSTPTLCHSGFSIAQLASCYLSSVEDDLQNIFDCYGDTAQLSKWAGGIATGWSKVRACGAHVKKTNSESQGIIPYLKIEDDIISAISKVGTKRAGKAVYLEVWHYDIEDFLDLKKNTGDHRRRTHDLNTAVWVSDLFMEKVKSDGEWCLFSPDEAPLTECYGKEFAREYSKYEALGRAGKLSLFKVIAAKELWRKILVRLFETGHPWINFKDSCNIRSPQKHCGVIHSSNLCTEITLNTSDSEIAVCNLGSINLEKHVDKKTKEINWKALEATIKKAVRMLDNVIDLTYYPVEKAKRSNLRHRPIGLGVMGWQDLFFIKNVAFDSEEALLLTNKVSEFISYHAIEASISLAQERGAYESYKGSLWDQGVLPHETLSLLEKERERKVLMMQNDKQCDWGGLKKRLAKYGIRNSNTQAIAPTATISMIAGSFPSIEAMYKNMYVKSNLSGEFTIVNDYLIADLKERGLWNDAMQERIKFHDGSLNFEGIPLSLRALYKTAFEIDQKDAIRLAAVRGQWIDQSQSLNIFFGGVSGKELDAIYSFAWECGLKTTYYLRTLGKSQIEKSTLGAEYGLTQRREIKKNNNLCTVTNDAECESCQ